MVQELIGIFDNFLSAPGEFAFFTQILAYLLGVGVLILPIVFVFAVLWRLLR